MWVLAILKAGEHLSSYMITCISLLLVLHPPGGFNSRFWCDKCPSSAHHLSHAIRGTKSPNSPCSIASQLVWFLKLTRCVTNVDALLWGRATFGSVS